MFASHLTRVAMDLGGKLLALGKAHTYNPAHRDSGPGVQRHREDVQDVPGFRLGRAAHGFRPGGLVNA